MGSFKVGDILIVKFPFSDLTDFKLRPAIVLFSEITNDYVLCQITSKPYSDKNAIQLIPAECLSGSLDRISYIRPLKLFTCNETIIYNKICSVKVKIINSLKNKLIEILNK